MEDLVVSETPKASTLMYTMKVEESQQLPPCQLIKVLTL